MSRTLATKSGPVDSLKVSNRCGCRPKARHIRCTVETDSPLARAMLRELQWVALGGFVSRVRMITASIRASSIVRGVPDRGSSRRPSSRCSTKRRRHLPTVSGSIPRRDATTLLCSPSAQARMIRARCAKPCAVLRRDASDVNSRRSPSSSSNDPASTHNQSSLDQEGLLSSSRFGVRRTFDSGH
jgi:hypothetical protein